MLGFLYIVLGVALGICVAVACVMFYRRGVNDGLAIWRKQELQIGREPKEETTEETEEMVKRYQAILEYDPLVGAK